MLCLSSRISAAFLLRTLANITEICITLTALKDIKIIKTVLNNPDAYDGYDRMDSKFIRDGLMPAVEFMKKNPDKILWCGEFGSIRHAELESRGNWMNDAISFLKENKIPDLWDKTKKD